MGEEMMADRANGATSSPNAVPIPVPEKQRENIAEVMKLEMKQGQVRL